jgi:sugar/nucleoside kinase (ribokinase family)
VVVATRGERGSVALADDGSVVAAGAFSVPVVDTTGAGDVFHGALLYALLSEQRIEQALVFANAAAGLSCRAVGGRPGCPSLHDVNALLGGTPTAVECYQE